MATIKHPDTYVCDICGAEFAEEQRVTLPVRQCDGMATGEPLGKPVLMEETLDLCDRCLDRAAVVIGRGLSWERRFGFRDDCHAGDK